jgi:hypothetical protein
MLRARSFRQAVTGTLFAVLASISTSPADSAPLFGLCLSEANVQGEAASHGHLSGVFNNQNAAPPPGDDRGAGDVARVATLLRHVHAIEVAVRLPGDAEGALSPRL